ncbi:exodeoxyribonuclease V subunit gamma [Leptospira levettii]|uniref:exodeoxyribonuclease V subunit gamma n=1 Tax=Leptospira levettii TaxID=2023178 RepID=UPI00223D4207|nr:exodeoxyribonuclease V subunit gamma [Leptospira levettii]MCW7509694.1 exodeoxyribonuclease V subunit gamma [Leptospira levettii]MCW7520781.1 exodeoxyribonuclease V subunit gamma [Leptospira levettii]
MPIHYFAGLHLHEITSELTKQIKKEQMENPLRMPLVVVPNTNLIPWLKLNIPKYNDSQLSINIEFTFLEKAILKTIFASLQIPTWAEEEEFYDYNSFKKDCFRFLYENQSSLFQNHPEIKTYISDLPKLYYLSDLLTKYFKDYELNRSDWIHNWLRDTKTQIPSQLTKDPYWELEKEIYLGINQGGKQNLFYYLEKGKELSLQGSLHFFCLSNLSGTYIDFLKTVSKNPNANLNIYIYQFHNGKVIGQNPEKAKNTLSKFAKPQSYLAKEFSNLTKQKDKSKYVSGGMLAKLKSILLEEPVKEENYLNDQTVRVWNAPSEYREMESIAHDILHKISASKGTLSLLDFAILVPNTNDYKAAIEWVFHGGIYTTQRIEETPTLHRLNYSLSDLVAKDSSLLYKVFAILFPSFLNQRIEKEDFIQLLENPLITGKNKTTSSDQTNSVSQLLNSLGSLYEENKEENPYTISFGVKRAVLSVISDEETTWDRMGMITDPLAEENSVLYLNLVWEEIKSLQSFFTSEFLQLPAGERFKSFESKWNLFFKFSEETENERIYFTTWLETIAKWCDTEWKNVNDFLQFLKLQTDEIFSNISAQKGNYLTEGITISLLQPMRPIPFSHIYIVGLGEGKFPGSKDLSRFNLRKNDSKPWDLNRIEIQESLLWETILSAEDSITFSYVGKNTLEDKEFEPCSSLFEIMNSLGIDRATEIPLTPYSRFYEKEILHSYDFARNLKQYRSLQTELPKPSFTSLEDLALPSSELKWKKEISITSIAAAFQNPILPYIKENLGYMDDEEETSSEEPFYFNSLESFLFKAKFVPLFTESLANEEPWPWDKNTIGQKINEFSTIAEQKAEFPYGAFHLVTTETLLEELTEIAEVYQSLKAELFSNSNEVQYVSSLSIGDTGLRDGFQLPAFSLDENQSITGEWENLIAIGDTYYWFYPRSFVPKPEKPNDYFKDYLKDFFGKMILLFLSACLFRTIGKKLIIIPILAKEFSTVDILHFESLPENDSANYIRSVVALINESPPMYVPNPGLNLFFAEMGKKKLEEAGDDLETAWKEFLEEKSDQILEYESEHMKLSPYGKELLNQFSFEKVYPLLLPLLKKGF